MRPLLEELATGRHLVSDGAWGTALQQSGLETGTCPELWNVTHRTEVLGIALSYVEAGADIILTNSFGGNPYKLAHYGLRERTSELNKAAAAISREAAGADHYVLGSIGPSGIILMMGEVTEAALYDAFRIQAEALAKGGADAICVETMSALDEASLAIRAARDATGLAVICTFTFEKTLDGAYRTMMGVSPSSMVEAVKAAGASVIGANCGNGFDQMIDIVQQIRREDNTTPILIQANAGTPIVNNNETVFPEKPAAMAAKVGALIKNGANIIGGCCGTTPAHIRAIAKAIKEN